MPSFEYDEDPKQPHAMLVRKKRDEARERGEAREGRDRDDPRRVHVVANRNRRS